MSTPPSAPGRPFFSIIIPTYDRAAMLPRVLGSVARQDHPSWEAVVADDGSNDDTAGVVRAFGDARVRYLRHAVNRGVCAARNTAIAASRGRWMVMLDSDFELLPGALRTLEARCLAAPDDTGNVASLMSWDNGPPSPIPTPAVDLSLLYLEYLRWVASVTHSEYFNCVRREVFDVVRYPEGRAYESEFNLNLARRFRFLLVREHLCLAHTDARDRITRGPALRRARRLLRDAPDWSRSVEGTRRDHGEAMRAAAPDYYDHFAVHLANLRLLAGDRRGALAALAEARPAAVASPRTLLLTGLGLLDRRLLALAQGIRA
jgi:glycosyltransferase involved in cell wall biosynthesis